MHKSLFFILALLLFACKEPGISPLPDPDPILGVNLSQPEVGQKSYFLCYETTCSKPTKDFVFTADTLVLEVLKEQGQWLLQESLTVHSPMYLNGAFQEPVRTPFESHGTFALLPDRGISPLFFFYGNDTLHLAADFKVELIQDGCQLFLNNDAFIGNEIGQVERFEIGPLSLKNKTAVSCVPTVLDLDAYLIYDQGTISMSHTMRFDMMREEGMIRGWVAVGN